MIRARYPGHNWFRGKPAPDPPEPSNEQLGNALSWWWRDWARRYPRDPGRRVADDLIGHVVGLLAERRRGRAAERRARR